MNGQIDKVYAALEKLSKIKKSKRPKIELQFLVFSHNEDEIPKLKQIKKKYNIDKTSLKTAQVYTPEQIEVLPKSSKYSRYNIDENGKAILKNELPNSCKRIIFGSVICWNGDVVPCCFDKDADFNMGNIKEENFFQIWQSDKYNEFRKTVFSQRSKIEMCNNCTEGLKHD